jgi:hypothetical protein
MSRHRAANRIARNKSRGAYWPRGASGPVGGAATGLAQESREK